MSGGDVPGEIRGICSMATQGLLQAAAPMYTQRTGVKLSFEPAGGVEAARRVLAGESFDVVVLMSDAIDQLVAAGRLDGAGRVDLVRSGVGVAVPAGAPRPDVSTPEAVRRAVLAAERVAYSTGPSGVALIALFQRWGIAGELQGKLVQAPPGVPVGAVLARREASLGFQQVSELIGIEGIDLIGPLPDAIQVITVFSAAPGISTAQSGAVRALLDFLTSAECEGARQRHGLARA